MLEGERSTTVVLWREIQVSRHSDNEDNDDGHRRMFARAFSVFNVAQVEGYKRPSTPVPPGAERLAHAEAFIANLGVKTEFGGSEAYYRPSTDTVFMPPFTSFRDAASFYGCGFMNAGTPAVPSTGSTAIFPGASDQRHMPPKNAVWKFLAGSSLLISASLTIHGPIMLPMSPRGSRS